MSWPCRTVAIEVGLQNGGMACGLAMMIMSRSLILSLESTRDAYYEQYRFAEVFCGVKRAPNALRRCCRRRRNR